MNRSAVWTTKVPAGSLDLKNTICRAYGPSLITAPSVDIRPGSSPMSSVSGAMRAPVWAVAGSGRHAQSQPLATAASTVRVTSAVRPSTCLLGLISSSSERRVHRASGAAANIDECSVAPMRFRIDKAHGHEIVRCGKDLTILRIARRRLEAEIGPSCRRALEPEFVEL